MQGHCSVNPDDGPTRATESLAEFGLLPGRDRWVIPADGPECLGPDHRVPPARQNLTVARPRLGRRIPLHVGHAVVDRLIAVSLVATPEDDRGLWTTLKRGAGLGKPAIDDLAVTVEELDETHLRIDLRQPLETRVPGCAAVKGDDTSSSTTSTSRARAIAMLSSVDPEST